MNMIFDILANILSIILILDIYASYKFRGEEKTFWKILSEALWLLFGASIGIAVVGYGNFYMTIINLTLAIVVYAFFLKDKSLLTIILRGTMIIFCLYGIYKRLEGKGIMEFEFINKLENVDVFEIFSSITQNEWFKGIFIAALGGIISGLVLNKISKKK